jgi:leucyl/phenylalanyl-tRNA--protein transferase
MEQIPPHVLLGAYTEGVFPMAEEGEVLWFSPLMRGMIPLDENFHVPHGLERRLRNNPFEIRIDTAFREVMENCGQREETWIDPVIIDSYCELHDLGFAHSVECWDEEGLQGGLYGVSLGKAFFGESMFSKKTDASKVALVHLVEWLRRRGVILLDTQWMTDHLRQFGGVEIPREEYLKLLDEALQEMGESDQES